MSCAYAFSRLFARKSFRFSTRPTRDTRFPVKLGPELRPLEQASEDIRFFGQRAVVTCSTRCFAIAYAISNENNTVSIVEPR